jgi:methylase of polypeptide subunit release factors
MGLYGRHGTLPEDRKPRVFDFGCGSGRLARFLDMAPGIDGFGSDVNADQVAWCQANLDE